MSNQRRQFLGLAAGAIAVPATAGMVVAQGDPSRGREAPIPAQSTLADLAKIRAKHGGGSGIAFAWEMQLLGTSKP